MNFKYVENYISIIKARYKSLQKANAYPFAFRIIDEEISAKNGKFLFILQLVGKNLISKLSINEITGDKQLLKSLSPTDLLKILNSLNKKKKKLLKKNENVIPFPCQTYYKLIAKNYNSIRQKTIFTLEITHANKITQKKIPAFEIANNPLILEKLTPQEIYELGYTVGSEAILRKILSLPKL